MLKNYISPHLVAIDLSESDAVRTSTIHASEKGFGDIFADVDSTDPGTDVQ